MKRTAMITVLTVVCALFCVADAHAQNSLAVTSALPAGSPSLVGTYSLKVTYDPSSTNATYVESNDPTNETVHRVNILLYLDTNGGADDWADSDKHQVLKARQLDPTPATVWRAHVRKITEVDPTGKYRMVMWCNGGGSLSAGQEFVAEFYLLENRWQEFGFEWAAESSPGAGDGVCTMWKAGNYALRRGLTTMTGTSSFNVDTQYLGAFDFAVHSNTRGSMFYDNFESYRTLGQ